MSHKAKAFTIVELVVSIGILGILMVVAGGVFALTLKSSGQATAVIDIHQSLRALEDSLREDLRYVNPSASVMVIQSHAINSYWTADAKDIDLDANPLNQSEPRDPQREKVVASKVEVEPPRADILMFFTARPGTSFRDPQVSGTLQQVVYGHALPGEWDAVTKRWTPTIPPPGNFMDAYAESSFTPDQLQHMGMDYQYQAVSASPVSNPPVFAIPARDWHLARRSVLIVDQDLANPPFFSAAWLNDGAVKVSGNEDDPNYQGIPKTFYVRDGRRDYLVNGVDPFLPEFVYQYDVINRLKANNGDSIYQSGEGPGRSPVFDVDDTQPEALVSQMPRTLLDSAPPSNQVDRMGQYFLPHCASFKVEWALDVSDVVELFDAKDMFGNQTCVSFRGDFLWGKEILWIDPFHFAETIDRIRSHRADFFDPSGTCNFDDIFYAGLTSKLILPGNDYQIRPNPDRFVDTSGSNVRPYDTHIFYASKPFSTYTQQQNIVDDPDPLFPKALRITVDVYDPAGRLDRPIRHVMVIPVGE